MLKYISKMFHLSMFNGPQLVSSTWYVFEVFFILSDKASKQIGLLASICMSLNILYDTSQSSQYHSGIRQNLEVTSSFL